MRCLNALRLPLRWLLLLAAALLALTLTAEAVATTHVVAPGHTLAKIARRYRVSVEALREANNLVAGQKLKPGQRIEIPEPGSAPSGRAQLARSRNADAQAEERDSLRELRQQRAATARPTETYARRSRRPGTVTLSRGSERWAGKTVAPDRRPAPTAAQAFRRMLRDDSSGTTRDIDPRLITLITQVSDHFGGRPIDIVSGYRRHTETQHTAHSSHNVGRAIDFSVRGVPNEVVRDYLHKLSAVGVGYYPNSTFVHLDVRATTTHWVDESGPGDPPRYTSVTNGAPAPSRAQPARQDRGTGSAAAAPALEDQED